MAGILANLGEHGSTVFCDLLTEALRYRLIEIVGIDGCY
jgi:hypothetical protein